MARDYSGEPRLVTESSCCRHIAVTPAREDGLLVLAQLLDHFQHGNAAAFAAMLGAHPEYAARSLDGIDPGYNGSTLLHLVAATSGDADVSAFSAALIEALERSATCVNSLRDADGNLPANWAAMVGNAAVLQQLKRAGADLTLSNRLGTCPVIDAGRSNIRVSLQAIIALEGSSVLANENIYGKNALIRACLDFSEQSIAVIAEADRAMLNRCNRYGFAPLDVLEWRLLWLKEKARQDGRSLNAALLARPRAARRLLRNCGAQHSTFWAALAPHEKLSHPPVNMGIWKAYIGSIAQDAHFTPESYDAIYGIGSVEGIH